MERSVQVAEIVHLPGSQAHYAGDVPLPCTRPVRSWDMADGISGRLNASCHVAVHHSTSWTSLPCPESVSTLPGSEEQSKDVANRETEDEPAPERLPRPQARLRDLSLDTCFESVRRSSQVLAGLLIGLAMVLRFGLESSKRIHESKISSNRSNEVMKRTELEQPAEACGRAGCTNMFNKSLSTMSATHWVTARRSVDHRFFHGLSITSDGFLGLQLRANVLSLCK